MEELSKFRKFLNENREKTNEIFGFRGTKDQTQKAAEALEALEKALFELNFLDILGDEDYADWLLKYEELRGRVMAGLDDESREKYDVALMDDIAESDFGNDPEDRYKYARKFTADLPDTARSEYLVSALDDALEDYRLTDEVGEFDQAFVDIMKALGKEKELSEDLSENDAALDKIINEARPNLKKALPKIAARNVERNNNINFDIEEMMDMVGEAGKGEKSEEAKILFKASNASDELEQALVDLQVYFEDDLGEGKKEIDEVKDAKFEVGDKVKMKAGGEEMEITKARRLFGSDTQGYTVKKADGKTAEYSANQLKKA